MSAPKTPVVHSAFLIGLASLAGLLLLSWIVTLRLGDIDMPMGELANMNRPFGTPADLTRYVMDGVEEGALPVLAPAMPEFVDISSWLDAEPRTAASLKGTVTLIDFWTYSCINCIRTLPYVTAWHERYKDQGFTVIGVHTPEFAFEKEEKNVRDAIARHKITYPVALDNGYGTWNNYSNRYWPAHYLFDAEGRLRYVHFGEGKYDETEANIRSLIEEAGRQAEGPMVDAAPAPDFSKIGTHETYLGYDREEYLGSPERMLRDASQKYSAPASPRENVFYLVGTWRVESERAVLESAAGGITYRYRAAAANLVMGGTEGMVTAEVTLDGAPVSQALRGADVVERDGKTYVDVSGQRLYNLIDAKGEYSARTLRIEFLKSGVEAYAFTFG